MRTEGCANTKAATVHAWPGCGSYRCSCQRNNVAQMHGVLARVVGGEGARRMHLELELAQAAKFEGRRVI